MNSDFAYLLGASGDACVYNRESKQEYCIEYEQKNPDWLERSVRPRILKIFGKHCAVRKRKTGLFRIRLYSKKAYSAFKEALERPFKILREPETVRRAYVRGFFDAEGSAPREKTSKRIEFYQKDTRFLRLIHKILRGIGIRPEKITNSREIGQPIIRGKENIRLFKSNIDCEHPDKRAALFTL